MPGTINSLGLGSGVLTADLVDKLKNAEKAATVTPIEGKITLAKQKQEAMDLLTSLTTAFKSNVSALSQDSLYQNRTINGNNDAVSVTAANGTNVQSINISDISLATSNVQQSGSFAAKTDTVATGDGTLNISVGGENFAIDYTSTTTLDDLKSSITNSGANDKLTASILQIGENDFTLVLTSKDTGADQSIVLSDNTGNLNSDLLSSSHKSGVFLAEDDFIANAGTTGDVQIDVNGTTANFSYDDTTTLAQLRDSINADTNINSVVSASIVKEGDNDFKLILTPIGAESGNPVTVTDSAAGLDTRILSTGSTTTAGTLTEVQSAKDASFKYNGINITRSSNTVNDISSGITISLLKDAGSANISISQDRSPITDELNNFVTSYNTLQKQLTSMTKADLEKGSIGIFNGDTSIRNLGREITRFVTSVDLQGNSLAQHGISLDREGTMSFNSTEFNAKMDENPDNVGVFFSGKTTVDANEIATHEEGVFEKLNAKLLNYTNSNDGLLSLFNDGLETEFDSLQKQYTKTLDNLNARFDLMTQRFIAYDTIINRINSQGSSLAQQIEMAVAAAKG